MEKENTGKYHVTKHPSGWQVVLGGGKKAIKTFKTQKEALDYAESLAENRNSTVYLHGRKGYIRDAVSYKEEPKKPAKKVEVKKEAAKKATAKKVETKKAEPKKTAVAKKPVKKVETKPTKKVEAKKETKPVKKVESKKTSKTPDKKKVAKKK